MSDITAKTIQSTSQSFYSRLDNPVATAMDLSMEWQSYLKDKKYQRRAGESLASRFERKLELKTLEAKAFASTLATQMESADGPFSYQTE